MNDICDYRPIGPVLSFQSTKRGILAHLKDALLRMEAIRPGVIQFELRRHGSDQAQQPRFAVPFDPVQDARNSGLEVSTQIETAGAVLRTSEVVVTVGADPLRIDVHRHDGTRVIETVVDGAGAAWALADLNDAFVIRRRRTAADPFFGLGEKGGPGNRSGREYTMWNTDVLSDHASAEFEKQRQPGDPRGDHRNPEFDPFYVSIPLLYHQDGPGGPVAASFLDNAHRLHYDLSQPDEYRIHAAAGSYTEYIFAGPDVESILDNYTWLTGRPFLPPLWSLGYQQCRWHPYTDTEVEALASRHQAEGIPLDALWLDIDYMDDYRIFTWNRTRFPDPTAFMDRLAMQGVRVVTIIDPGLKEEAGYPVFDRAVESGYLCQTASGRPYVGQVWPGRTVFPDFVLPHVRQWWADLNTAHADLGVAGIWNDMNEPATGRIPPGRMRFDAGRASHDAFHNQYALLMAMGTVDGLQWSRPGQRTFVLSRAGSPGIQRYAANWMGDNLARWDHLAGSIAMACGFGLSGQPFVGADVGGFHGNTNPELFSRWMQYGALTPFFRNHSETGCIDQYCWSFGPVVTAQVRAAIELRYRLMPYLYSAARHATLTGMPVQRPMVLADAQDPALAELDDQYLFGAHLLVAPVLAAGQRSRSVYLPAGHWYHWHTHECLPGRRLIVAATPAEWIPLYARAGAIIPMWTQAPASTAGFHPRIVQLWVFLPVDDGTTTSELFEDDGHSLDTLTGKSIHTRFTLTRSGARIRLTAEATGDGYPEFAREAFELVFVGAPVRAVSSDHQITNEAGTQRLLLPNRGQSFEVEIEDELG